MRYLPLFLCAALGTTAFADVDETLMNKSNVDYANGKWSAARDEARKADPGKDNTFAWRNIGGASCHLKDQPAANEAWAFFKKQVDKPSMKWMAKECAKDGYTYEPMN